MKLEETKQLLKDSRLYLIKFSTGMGMTININFKSRDLF